MRKKEKGVRGQFRVTRTTRENTLKSKQRSDSGRNSVGTVAEEGKERI